MQERAKFGKGLQDIEYLTEEELSALDPMHI
jgi:hypothetical protein